MKRQIFFCQIGGFDTHSRSKGSSALLRRLGRMRCCFRVSQAMKAFYDATVELGLQTT
jgi:uncharacterized protein (DUF1501 family)